MVISKRVITRELLPKAAKLKVLRLEISERGWDVEASGDRSAKCPTCATKSRSRHSRYRRKLRDLPVFGKLRSQMTAEQGNTVDALKKACPGYAVMRSLVMSFRTILRTGKIKTLHAWMKKADASGLYRMQRFVRRSKQDQSAVEAAVEQSWSNGPVGGHINRLKTLKRQMYGRAGFELLRARVLPLPPPAILHQE
jgi:transposase